MNTTAIGALIAELRQAQGWSQRELARRSGLTNSDIGVIENGTRVRPTAYALERIALALNVPLARLMEAAGYDLGIPQEPPAHSYARVPIIKRAAASNSTTLTREENVMDYLPLPSEQVADGSYFLYPAADDTMKGAGILAQESYVLIRQQRTADDGQIALVAVGMEDALLRYVQRAGDKLVLRASEADVPLRIVPAAVVCILGVATTVVTMRRL